MPTYSFSDIAINVNEKRMPTPEDKELYIAPNNLDTPTLSVPTYGYKVDLKGTKLVMHKGDMLFGRREPQLKKAAIAPHDGLFSAHGMIFHPITKVIREDFFPFFISSDYFFDTAIRISVGSLSPTVNWRDLKGIEFTIPTLKEQEEHSKVLWSMIEAKKAYMSLISATDALVKSKFYEMFGDPVDNDKKWPEYKFSDVASSRLGKMLDKKKQTGLFQKQYLANANVQWFSFDLTNLNQMDFDEADQKEFELRDGDLLMCEGGEIGRCAIWHNELEDCYFQKAIHRIRCHKEVLLPEYLAHLFYYHSQKNGFSDIVSSRSTIAHLPGDKLRAMTIFVPPIELQNEFVEFVNQCDNSKSLLVEAFNETNTLHKKIVADIFQYPRKEDD